MLRELLHTKTLILGAGVTGVSVGRALSRRGAEITFADEKVTTLEGFDVLLPSTVDLQNFDYVVTSPGWREDHPLLESARHHSKKILNEIDIAWWIKNEVSPSQKWLALTGTNGKTSTVELTAAALREGGLHAIACGNVGNTVIDAIESGEGYEYLVLELSSFQLHWLNEAHFVASAILNIADDHIDWHGSFENYTRDKMKILDRSSTAILNGNDGTIISASENWNGRKVFFTLDSPDAGEMGIVENLLIDRAFVADPQEAELIAEVNEVKPRAPHTVANALAAAGLARAAGVSHEAIRRAIVSFSPGQHRIQLVGEYEGIRWVDDSKATNPHAALASLYSSDSNIWIAGGLAKGARFDELVRKAHTQMKAVIIIGADGTLIEEALKKHAPHVPLFHVTPPEGYEKGGSSNSFMEAIVLKASALAHAGDTVLMAPACASMDQFDSYADRGNRFSSAVMKVFG